MSDRDPFFLTPTEHPNAPPKLRAKAGRIRRKAVKALGPAPATLEGWRSGYLRAVEAEEGLDIDAEYQRLVDEMREVAGKRLHRRGAS